MARMMQIRHGELRGLRQAGREEQKLQQWTHGKFGRIKKLQDCSPLGDPHDRELQIALAHLAETTAEIREVEKDETNPVPQDIPISNMRETAAGYTYLGQFTLPSIRRRSYNKTMILRR